MANKWNILILIFFGLYQAALGFEAEKFNDKGLFEVPSGAQINQVRQNMACYAQALTNGTFSLTLVDAWVVKKALEDYEKGKIDIEELNEKAGEGGVKFLIGYYLQYSNNISAKAKLPISRSFISLGIYPVAEKLARDYVSVYSNDWRGWKVLASLYSRMEMLDLTNGFSEVEISKQVIESLEKAIKLGDKESIPTLSLYAFVHGQDEIVRQNVSQLFKLKRSKKITRDCKESAISVLINWAIKTQQKDVFLDTLHGEDITELIKNADLKDSIKAGCVCFSGKEVEKIRFSIKSNTATNIQNSAN